MFALLARRTLCGSLSALYEVRAVRAQRGKMLLSQTAVCKLRVCSGTTWEAWL